MAIGIRAREIVRKGEPIHKVDDSLLLIGSIAKDLMDGHFNDFSVLMMMASN